MVVTQGTHRVVARTGDRGDDAKARGPVPWPSVKFCGSILGGDSTTEPRRNPQNLFPLRRRALRGDTTGPDLAVAGRDVGKDKIPAVGRDAT